MHVSGSVNIRRARVGEASALTELALRSKASWGYDVAFMAVCRAELTLSDEDVACGLTYVLQVDEAIQGFYALSSSGQGRMQLDQLFVEPRAKRRGYGRALLRHAEQCARDAGAVVLEIQSDPFAEGFYCSMGAVRRGYQPSASIAGRELPLLEVALGDADS